jgi:hypothetical protein
VTDALDSVLNLLRTVSVSRIKEKELETDKGSGAWSAGKNGARGN